MAHTALLISLASFSSLISCQTGDWALAMVPKYTRHITLPDYGPIYCSSSGEVRDAYYSQHVIYTRHALMGMPI
jgi:hypothetical protein